MPPVRPSILPLLIAAGAVVATCTPLAAQAVAQPPNAVQPAPAGAGAALPQVPPVPDGTPQQLLDFVKGLKQSDARPASRQEMMAWMRDVAAASVAAADKILVQVKPGQQFHDEAASLKLESLMLLGRLGDEKAAADMAAYARSLIDSPSPELAREAQRLVLVSDAQRMFAGGTVDGGPALVQRVAALLAADPNDQQTAGLALQLAGAFEHLPGGEEVAMLAYKSFGPLFAKSSDERIKAMGESFAGTLRRLALLGHPMEITGTLLGGQPFDQRSLAGKVVLVDFWATWCGPCVAEIPNVLEQYEKYHDQGFEVVGVSLDEDRDALETFVAERKIPWPILYEKPAGEGWRHPLATYYGISGIPTVILIGRDGKVVTLNARGEKLGEELDKMFKAKG
ncbi:MAG: TlpA family protein disulfide reductase [Planctomycetia bacterium]|nr:TlpA family protein disulfide reductase [Planctomycetia bacterium]